MQLLALIPLLLLLLQPISVLATTPNNDHMEKLKPGGVRREDTRPVRISFYDRGESKNEDRNLTCDEGDKGEKAVACRPLPFGDCCQGGNKELFDSARSDQVDGWTSFAVYTDNDRNSCGISPKSTKDSDITCLAGGEHGMTIFSVSLEGDNSGGGDGGGDDASIRENMGASKRKKRAVRAEWYTFTFRGMNYHIRMNSSLGETYRNLATKAEQREFAMEHGEPVPVVGRRVRAAR